MQLASYFQRVDKNSFKQFTSGLGAPIVVLALMGMVILPMPPVLLDALFSFNIALSLVIILVCVFTARPIDFGIFPLVLLVATVLRLALNVASTRVVLLEGHEGGDAAGKVIQAFGEVVIGGNYAVGVVVFAILLIINFKVVTAGAGRISEVNARFTLDAMPGKQMAIDADLNAGYIDQDQARKRREEITAEADFYGSMDGASKFVKGDAVAGLFIMMINIVGGLFIGMYQHGLGFSNAMEVYTMLTIGDGLVAQIPSLLLSVATAIIVTRENDTQEMGEEITEQLSNKQALYITAGILFIMGIVPGMPTFAFLSFSAIVGGYAFYREHNRKKLAEEAARVDAMPANTTASQEVKELGWDDVQQVDIIGLEVGYRLIPLVDKSQGGELLTRIKGVRKKLSQELGFLIPAVHIRDNLDFSPNAYNISMLGVSVGEADISHDSELAINPGQVFGTLEGKVTKDPAFGLEAVWIKKNQREHAQTLGYTVVDAATVVATHLSQLLTTHAHQLLGHEEVQQLLDMLEKTHPKLVEGLVPDILPLSTVVKVLQTLLFEGVPIRDMRTIVQTLAEFGPKSQDPDVLVSALRIALKRLIVQEITNGAAEIPVITLAPELEQMLHKSLQAGGEDGAGIEPGLAERLQESLSQAYQQQELAAEPAVLLTSGMLRPVLSRFLKQSVSGLHVLSYQEIPDDKQIKIVSSVGQ
ncbi:flagellar biosynthesis protein FlhA [Glaciecola sp. XM2]|jgi:flagellar biosynthesis protein FlhA|uniref:flagellar biosynthesis protein FlhA n=1 Tax=Glaciecola sp. XM2 TaxID=1914931 RepID=UPI001BDF28BB|nr:flagellar biosynthesis protein FlhA [Glaciecola sp. XM2]MBT1450838.1 flagellar biosynthesis protein FlhA [Glaciecola sp. XM2]